VRFILSPNPKVVCRSLVVTLQIAERAKLKHTVKCVVLINVTFKKQESLALASMARDDPHASRTASSTAAAMRGKVGSEFET